MAKSATVVITGVAGLLGNNLARHIAAHGLPGISACDIAIVGIDDFSGWPKNAQPRSAPTGEVLAEFHLVDLSDRETAPGCLSGIFARHKNVVAVYHFAAYAAEGLSPFIRSYNYTNNVVGYSHVVNACVNAGADGGAMPKLVVASSIAVYGDSEPLPFSEDETPPKPVDPYGVAKLAIEQDVACAASLFGLRYTVVRPHNIIGEYQNMWDRYRNVLAIWSRQLLRGEPVTIFGDGSQTRAFSDVAVYMDPLARFAVDPATDGETFNLGGDTPYSVKHLADLLLEAAADEGVSVEKGVEHLPPRHEVAHAYCSHEKARRLLGFVDTTDIRALVRRFFKWALAEYNDTPAHLRVPVDMRYEVVSKMPQSWLAPGGGSRPVVAMLAIYSDTSPLSTDVRVSSCGGAGGPTVYTQAYHVAMAHKPWERASAATAAEFRMYYVTFDHTLSEIEYDAARAMIRVPGFREGHHGHTLYIKTAAAVRWLLANFPEIDYIVRTNVTTAWHYRNLARFFTERKYVPETIAGHVEPGCVHVHGQGIIADAYTWNQLVNHVSRENREALHVDDVQITADAVMKLGMRVQVTRGIMSCTHGADLCGVMGNPNVFSDEDVAGLLASDSVLYFRTKNPFSLETEIENFARLTSVL